MGAPGNTAVASTINVKIIMIEITEMMGVATAEGPEEEEEDRAEMAQIEEATDAETGMTTGPPEEEEVDLTLQMVMMMTMMMMRIQVRKIARLKMIMKIAGTWKQTRS